MRQSHSGPRAGPDAGGGREQGPQEEARHEREHVGEQGDGLDAEDAAAERAGEDLNDVGERDERVAGLVTRREELRRPAEEGHVGEHEGGEIGHGGGDPAGGADVPGQNHEPQQLDGNDQRGEQVGVDGEAGEHVEGDPRLPAPLLAEPDDGEERRGHENGEERVHLGLAAVPDAVGRGGEEERGDQGRGAIDNANEQGIEHGDRQGTEGQRREAEGELAVAGRGQPGTEGQEEQRAVLAGLAEHLEQLRERPGGEEQRVDLVAPEALREEGHGPQREGQEGYCQDDGPVDGRRPASGRLHDPTNGDRGATGG